MGNSSRILIRILVRNAAVVDCGILQEFFINQDSDEIIKGFLSEFWLLTLVSNNSDDYEILQELYMYDHGILEKFQSDFDQNSFQDWNDQGIL